MFQEKVPPIAQKRYAQTFRHMQNNSTQYEAMSLMAGNVIDDNGFKIEPIRMLR